MDAKLSHCPGCQGVWSLVAERIAKGKKVVEWCGGYDCHRKLSWRKRSGAEIRGTSGDLRGGGRKRELYGRTLLESDCEGQGLMGGEELWE